MTAPFRPDLSLEGFQAVARLFRTSDDLLDWLAGPAPHDAHVQAYKGELWLAEKQAAHARANAAVAALVDQMIAERKARRAA